jgi:hypothetical protein
VRKATNLKLEPLESRTLLATCHVTRLGDFGAGADIGGGHSRGDLRYCIIKANTEPGPDIIAFSVTGTINLTSALPDLASDIDIQGPGAGLLSVRRDTGGDYRIFTVAAGIVEIHDLTVTNGRADVGGGIYNQAALTLDAVVVNDNTGDGVEGGGIYNTGTLTLFDSTVSNNESNLYGAGIFNTEFGQATIEFSAISENIAGAGISNTRGGGIYNAGILTLRQSNVSNNRATLEGAGIYNTLLGQMTIESSLITGNIANTAAAGFARGGGIFTGGNLEIRLATISNNQARSIIGNQQRAFGGGIDNGVTGMLSIIDSTIAGNTAFCQQTGGAFAYGGGIHNSGSLAIHSSTISGNLSHTIAVGLTAAYGGGLAHMGGNATILHSTIADNTVFGQTTSGAGSALSLGGGINTAAAMTIVHSTIAGNYANSSGPSSNHGARGGGLNILASPIPALTHTIIATNRCGAVCAGADVIGNMASAGYNLIGDPRNGAGFDRDTDILNADAMLGPLANNGGPTQTMALLPGSPAIDAGDPSIADPPEWDQRGPGFARIVNGRIDIGAYEVQATGMPNPAPYLVLLVTADWEDE